MSILAISPFWRIQISMYGANAMATSYQAGEDPMQQERISNYEIQIEEWKKRFLKMDQDLICRKIPGIEKRNDSLVLWHFGRQLSVNRHDGTITCLSDDLPLGPNPKGNVYTLFYFSSPLARIKGDWVAFRELRNTAPFDPAFKRGVLDAMAYTFAGHEDKLEEAVQKIRGRRISSTGFELKAFECIPIRINFWDADDEFPASANMLFDSSATDFIHEESIVSIATEALDQLATAANLPVDPAAMGVYSNETMGNVE